MSSVGKRRSPRPPQGGQGSGRARAAPRRAADGLRAIGRRPLFSGAAVARTERLAFQRTDEIVLARDDALRLGIAAGDAVDRAPRGRRDDGHRAPLAHARARASVRFAWDGAPVDGACSVEGQA